MNVRIICFLLVFFLFGYFRFYNLDKRIGFGWDQEQYAVQVRQLVKDHRPVLIGPRVNNVKGFFLAPYFTYLITPFFLMTNLHPRAILYFLIFFNFLFFFLSFFFIKSMFKEVYAYLFLLFWSINPLLAGYDTISWWPVWIPLGTVITWWLLYKIYKENYSSWWILLGLCLGFFFNMHFQFVLMVLFSVFFLIISARTKKFPIKKPIFSILAFILTFLPLFIFDLRHDFLNIKLFFGFLSQGTDKSVINYFAWIPVFNNLIKPLINVASNTVTVLFYFIFLGLFYLLYRIKNNFFKTFYLSAIFLWLIFPIVFAKYGKRPSEYYFIFLYPFIFLSLIDMIMQVPKKIALLIFLIGLPLLFFANLNSLFNRLKPDYYSLYYMDKLVKQFAPFTRDKRFNIAFDVPVGGDSGYRYLFDYYQIKQTGDWGDPLIRLIRPATKECQFKSEAAGIFIPLEIKF